MPPECKICGQHYWDGHPCDCQVNRKIVMTIDEEKDQISIMAKRMEYEQAKKPVMGESDGIGAGKAAEGNFVKDYSSPAKTALVQKLVNACQKYMDDGDDGDIEIAIFEALTEAQAWLSQQGKCGARTKEQYEIERKETIAKLRQICGDYGDNEWADDLHMADIIEKHLYRNLYTSQQEARRE